MVWNENVCTIYSPISLKRHLIEAHPSIKSQSLPESAVPTHFNSRLNLLGAELKGRFWFHWFKMVSAILHFNIVPGASPMNKEKAQIMNCLSPDNSFILERGSGTAGWEGTGWVRTRHPRPVCRQQVGPPGAGLDCLGPGFHSVGISNGRVSVFLGYMACF